MSEPKSSQGLRGARTEGERTLDDLSQVGRVSSESLFTGRIVHLSLDTVRFPDGSTGQLELVAHPGASAVVPFLDSPIGPDPRIVLLRQYRYAAGGPVYEVPAGMPRGQEETWAECASRELIEETGFEAGDLRYLTRIYTTPGFSDEVIHLFAATDLRECASQRDHDEFLEVVTVSLSQAIEGVRSGEIIDAKSVAAVLFSAAFLGTVWEERRRAPPR